MRHLIFHAQNKTALLYQQDTFHKKKINNLHPQLQQFSVTSHKKKGNDFVVYEVHYSLVSYWIKKLLTKTSSPSPHLHMLDMRKKWLIPTWWCFLMVGIRSISQPPVAPCFTLRRWSVYSLHNKGPKMSHLVRIINFLEHFRVRSFQPT